MKSKIIFFGLILGLVSFVNITDNGFYVFYTPKNWPKPIYDFEKNELTADKIKLGRFLFYDPILSKDNTISCASCHSQYTAFTHVDHALSHGIYDRVGTRNSLALVNLAWHNTFMWDGAINHLDVQALAPINHEKEMGESTKNVIKKLQKTKLYKTMFYNAYGDSVVTTKKMLQAISQFMLTLVSANSKYDKVKNNLDTFTQQEKNGYELFKQNCASCHAEPLFTSLQFENNGLPIDTTLNDFGRMKITNKKIDALKFKVPTLRNIEFSTPYMHDGRFKKISEVLNHYTNGIQPSKTLSVHLQKPIVLNSNEKVDLTAFLLTLTDKEFLFNSKFSFPKDLNLNRSDY